MSVLNRRGDGIAHGSPFPGLRRSLRPTSEVEHQQSIVTGRGRFLPAGAHFATVANGEEEKGKRRNVAKKPLLRQLTQSGPRHILRSLVEHIWPSGSWGGIYGAKSRVCLALGLMWVHRARFVSARSRWRVGD